MTQQETTETLTAEQVEALDFQSLIAEQRARPKLVWVKCYDCAEQFQEAFNPKLGRSAYCPKCCSDPQDDEREYDPCGD